MVGGFEVDSQLPPPGDSYRPFATENRHQHTSWFFAAADAAMIRLRQVLSALYFVLLLPAVNGWGKGDVHRGKELYASCIPCHGTDGGGNVANSTPRLTNQHAWYLVRQLKNFKKGLRGYHTNDVYGIQMRVLADALEDDAVVDDVVAYIQTLDSPESPPSVGGNPKRGKAHYKACRSCHGGRGEGKKSLFTPRINHQHDWYLLRQLMNFRGDFRGTHPTDNYGGRMWAAARAIPDDETVRDIVGYVKSLD